MRLIDAELTQKNITGHLVQILHTGNKEVDELMRIYNPSSVRAGISYGMDIANTIVHNQSTVEAKPVVHGEWIETHEHKWKLDDNGEIDECSWFKGYCNGVTCEICGERICVHCHPNWKESKCYATSYKCSVCGYHEKEKSNFCLNCGTDMRGGKND